MAIINRTDHIKERVLELIASDFDYEDVIELLWAEWGLENRRSAEIIGEMSDKWFKENKKSIKSGGLKDFERYVLFCYGRQGELKSEVPSLDIDFLLSIYSNWKNKCIWNTGKIIKINILNEKVLDVLFDATGTEVM